MKYMLFVNGQYHSSFTKKNEQSAVLYAKAKSLLFGYNARVSLYDAEQKYICSYYMGFIEREE